MKCNQQSRNSHWSSVSKILESVESDHSIKILTFDRKKAKFLLFASKFKTVCALMDF